MSWRRVLKSVQALVAYFLLQSFTLLLVLKLDHFVSCSWWLSLPEEDFHYLHHLFLTVDTGPLAMLLWRRLCLLPLNCYFVHTWRALTIVFLPLLVLEIIILIDNFRMCRALMSGDDDHTSDEAIWETVPHFWVAISMVFFVVATISILLKLCGDISALGWWDLFINFGQVVAVLFAASRLIERIVLLLLSGASAGRYFNYASSFHDFLAFLHHASQLLGWWSIEEGSREKQARVYHEGASGYNTFGRYPSEIVKKMPKKDLAEEEKVLCRVCLEREISVVLLPCRRRVLCSNCCEKCKKCLICTGRSWMEVLR